MDILLLGAEYDQAALARDPAQYAADHVLTLAGAGKTPWTNGAANPVSDIDPARETIRSTIGRYPNTLIMGPAAFNAAKNSPLVIEKIKYTSSASITADMLASQRNLKRVVVGEADYANDQDVMVDVWGADAILAYLPEGGPSIHTPSYGYTYVLDGNPFVEVAQFEAKIKSWLYPTTYERNLAMVGPGAGFLLRNVAG
ncbi:MAG: major capsid protein [Magnetococcales bacterium]|nr:major capsid protein [Magnetococcales bacterium]